MSAEPAALQNVLALTNAKQSGPHEWRACCPVHGGGNKDAFVIRTDGDTLLYYCHAGCTQEEVTAHFIEHDVFPKGESKYKKLEVPYPEFKGMPLVKKYRYKNGWVGRYEKDGEKAVIPFFVNHGSKAGYPKDPNWKRPIYDPSGALSKDSALYISEGEKCVDALVKLGIPAITWCGGAKGFNRVDWSEVTKRKVYIWPDNDKPGTDAASGIKKILTGQECVVHICAVPDGLGEGGDCADLITEATTKEQILEIFHAGSVKRLPRMSFADLIAANIRKRELVFGFLYEQSINQIHAWRGVGKSWFSLSIAYAIATGTPFLRYKSSRIAPVFYLDGEMALSTLQERLRMIMGQNGDLVPQQFELINPEINGGLIPKLSTEEGRAAVDLQIEDARSEFIFVDNISSLVGGDENDALMWEPIQDWAIAHKAKGRSVVFIHHSGKSGTQRGTSKKEDVMDSVIALRRPEFEQSERKPQGAFFEVHVEKSREYADENPFMAWLQQERGPRGNLDIVTKWCSSEIADFKKQRALALSNGGYSQREISMIMGIPKTTILRWLQEEFESGGEKDEAPE